MYPLCLSKTYTNEGWHTYYHHCCVCHKTSFLHKDWVTGRQKGVQSEVEYVGNVRLQIRYKNLDILRAAASITEHIARSRKITCGWTWAHRWKGIRTVTATTSFSDTLQIVSPAPISLHNVFVRAAVPSGPGPPHYRDFTMTYRHTRWDASGQVISSRQHTALIDIHAPGGIRTHNPSKQVAEDSRLRPRGHWGLPSSHILNRITVHRNFWKKRFQKLFFQKFLCTEINGSRTRKHQGH